MKGKVTKVCGFKNGVRVAFKKQTSFEGRFLMKDMIQVYKIISSFDSAERGE